MRVAVRVGLSGFRSSCCGREVPCTFPLDSDFSGLTFAVRSFGRSEMRDHELVPKESIVPPQMECPSCGRNVYLNREGCYRRHFAVEPDGRRHLCAASRVPVGIQRRALRRLNL